MISRVELRTKQYMEIEHRERLVSESNTIEEQRIWNGKQERLGRTRKEDLSATKERQNGAMESTIPQMEVVMETLIEKRAIRFWKMTEASFDGKREEGKDGALRWSQALKRNGVITCHCANESNISLLQDRTWQIWKADLSSRAVCACVRICLL